MNDSYSILIIEDEKNILDFMSRTLKANGYKTTTVTSGKAWVVHYQFTVPGSDPFGPWTSGHGWK